jgi:hypothetical protein
MEVCFVADCHYPNYTKRLKSNLLQTFIDLELDKYGFTFLVSTNRPEDFQDIVNDKIHVFHIDELRKDFPISKQYETLPEDPSGIYPAGFHWGLERFLLKKAADMGFKCVVNFDSDVILNNLKSGNNLLDFFKKNYQPNIIMTNQATMLYQKSSENEIFYLHDKYINHFGLDFQDSEYTTMDGPVICYMGETSEDLQRYFRNWNELTEFSYKKEHGYGYGGIVCGIWSLTIPMSGFKLKWNEMPFVPHHVYSDRY